MVTMGVFPFQGKTHMVEPGIEPGTSWLVDRSSDHQATRLVSLVDIYDIMEELSYSLYGRGESDSHSSTLMKDSPPKRR